MPDFPPADPFGPLHAGAVTMLEMFRSYRRAGAGWLEAAFILGGSWPAARRRA